MNSIGTRREKVFDLTAEQELNTAAFWRVLPWSFRTPRSGMATIISGHFAFADQVPAIAHRLRDTGPFRDGSYLIRFGRNPIFVWKIILERDGY